jgi:hypothetical protein
MKAGRIRRSVPGGAGVIEGVGEVEATGPLHVGHLFEGSIMFVLPLPDEKAQRGYTRSSRRPGHPPKFTRSLPSVGKIIAGKMIFRPGFRTSQFATRTSGGLLSRRSSARLGPRSTVAPRMVQTSVLSCLDFMRTSMASSRSWTCSPLRGKSERDRIGVTASGEDGFPFTERRDLSP